MHPTATLRSRRSLFFALLVVLAAGSAVACGGDSDSSTAPDPAEIIGRYDLVSIDGDDLPAVLLQSGDETIEATAGFIDLRSSGAIFSEFTVRVTSGGQTRTDTVAATGRWLRSGGTVVLAWDDGCSDRATVSGGELTFTDCDLGLRLVFRK